MFTYDVSSDIGNVRLEVGDTCEGKGPMPNGGNFSDEEIEALLVREGNTGRVTAAALEILATRWASYVDITVGPHSERQSQASSAFAARAAALRKQHGYATDEANAFGTIATGFVRGDTLSSEYGRDVILVQT